MLDKRNRTSCHIKAIKKLVFLFPILVLLIGAVAIICFSRSPEKAEELIFWIFTDLANAIKDANFSKFFEPNSSIPLGFKIFSLLWLSCFIFSLFNVGRNLHKKPQPVSEAIFSKKEPYLLIQGLNDCLKKADSNKLSAIIYDIKLLEERLHNESDFGYGNVNVIHCENEIAGNLQLLSDIIQNIQTNVIDEDIEKLNKVIFDINHLLSYRTNLKRR